MPVKTMNSTLLYHEPHCNKYYRYIIYNISCMNSSDFNLQTALMGLKMLKLSLPYHPLYQPLVIVTDECPVKIIYWVVGSGSDLMTYDK